MSKAKDFRKIARESLAGHWLSAVGTTLVAGILGGSVTLSGEGGFSTAGGASGSNGTEGVDPGIKEKIGGLSPEISVAIMAAIAVFVSAILIISLVRFIVGSFVSLGLIRYNLNLIDGKEASFGQIFSAAPMFGKALWLRFRKGLFTFLWTLLLIIPGIIKSFSYSMSGYIMAENPEMTAKEAMEVSMKMMKGNKWRFFCLNFSFIGWVLLCCITLGIATLWVDPYINASVTAFYDEISRDPMDE